MTMSTTRKKLLVMAGAVVFAASPVAHEVMAAPFATVGASAMATENLVEQVQAKRKRAPVAKARPRSRNNGAAAAAIIGLGVLGIAAAAAAAQNQPRRGEYYTDQWGNPVDAYGRPIYGQRPVQYYRQPGYDRQPGFYEQPGYYRRPQVNEWERQEFRAQQRAQREAQREQARREQRWAEQQQFRQQRYRQQPAYGGGPVYVDPRIDGRRGDIRIQRDADSTGGNRGN